MGGLFKTPKPARNPEFEAQQAAAARKAQEEAEAERVRLEEERRAAALGFRGRRGLLSAEGGERGFPTVLGGV